MATETLTQSDTVQSLSFRDLPPFPSDIPIAPLHRLVLSKLRADPAESERLFSASKDLGFFYLDLRQDDEGETLLAEAERLFRLEPAFYDLGREELEKYNYKSQGSYMGYKGYGSSVVDEKGNLDRNEFYNVRFLMSWIHIETLTAGTRSPKMTS
jgi:isopenicillin N synthase-like dioxygenase